MKTAQTLLIASALTLGLTACNDWHHCPRAKGEIETTSYDVADFNTIDMQTSGEVFITIDPNISFPDVEVRTHESIRENIDVHVKGSRLIIDTDPCVRRMKTFQVYVTTPDLNSIVVSGSADIHSQNTFVLDRLDLEVDGSGEMDIKMDVTNLNIDISGSGNLTLAGTADESDIFIDGSGDINAFGLSMLECDINVSGSGDCAVDVSDFLSVDISGSGDVTYEGNPETNIRINGSGDVRQR